MQSYLTLLCYNLVLYHFHFCTYLVVFLDCVWGGGSKIYSLTYQTEQYSHSIFLKIICSLEHILIFLYTGKNVGMTREIFVYLSVWKTGNSGRIRNQVFRFVNNWLLPEGNIIHAQNTLSLESD